MIDKRKAAYRLTGALILLLCAGCALQAGTPVRASAGNVADVPGTALQAIVEQPAVFAGKNISAEGVFLGWSGTCPGSAAVTRSDWILEDRTGCIYVTGRIPAGVSAAKPKRERLLVTGTVKTAKCGRPFLQAASVKKIQ
jgi:hypothetical protein